MRIEVRKAECSEVEPYRELYRHEANCQIVHDSSIRRGFTDPYLIFCGETLAGYAAVFRKHYDDRLMEFYSFPRFRESAEQMARSVLMKSRAKEIEAQTNMPLMKALLDALGHEIAAESTLFEDALCTDLRCASAVFRQRRPGDACTNADEPEGDWVLEVGGNLVANGGYLCHYNPPYGDVYMETAGGMRQKGYGSYLVQEVKRVCYENGKKPSARCDPSNQASRKTLERAGFRVCGQMLAGKVNADLI